MIELQQLNKRYGSHVVLDQVDLTIPDGIIYGLVGANGAGKSILLRILSGVMPPDHGTVWIDGVKMHPNSVAKQNIFYLPDNAYYFKQATPFSMGDFYKGLYEEFQMDVYESLLEQFGLNPYDKIYTFSKGMKKQVFLLAALCAGTNYILCDEMFDGLDGENRKLMGKLLKEQVDNLHKTVLLVSHHRDDFADLVSQSGTLAGGRIK